MLTSNIAVLKKEKRNIIAKYSQRSNFKATFQVVLTLIPFFFCLFFTAESLAKGAVLVGLISFVLSTLFLLRLFVLMHDCGHGCMFDHKQCNPLVGFVLGVVCGIPQFVWSKHHAYHHATNGNWNKYRGPLDIVSVSEFKSMTEKEQVSYKNQRRIFLAPLAGFVYFFFNPYFTWLKGQFQLLKYVAKHASTYSLKGLAQTASEFETHYWADWKEYRHMTAKNLAQFSLMAGVTAFTGSFVWVAVYLVVLAFGGALGLILFTVQHNFEDSHATGCDNWDYDVAAILGTSYLDLPRWLHWFTADIGYHHVHHLSASIPNYRLRECHNDHAELFSDVKIIKLKDVVKATKYILWDEEQDKLITINEFNAQYT